MDSKNPIKEEWSAYYHTLESIRRTGIVNMWGADSVLAEMERIPKDLAKKVLMSWIANYDELNKKYKWR